MSEGLALTLLNNTNEYNEESEIKPKPYINYEVEPRKTAKKNSLNDTAESVDMKIDSCVEITITICARLAPLSLTSCENTRMSNAE